MIKTSPFPITFLQDLPGLWGPRIQSVAAQQFDVTELQKRVLQKTRDKKKAKPAFYIDPRTLDHRLNLMFGGAWSVGFAIDQGDHLLVARATLNINGIVREDVSSEPILNVKDEWVDNKRTGKKISTVNEMATTKAQAAAYKRAAVKFGISAYLYDFKDEIIWLPIDDYGFKDKGITLQDLPQFARPTPGPQIVMEELTYLCDSEDSEILRSQLSKYWGLGTLKDLNRDDSFMLASCIARVADYLSFTGKNLEQLAQDRIDSAKSSSKMGFIDRE